ncbi:MAG: hypothetical protein ACRD2N_03945 [Vicinamibacterales bacterium]
MTPLVSIVIPTRNGAETLPRVKSIEQDAAEWQDIYEGVARKASGRATAHT